MSGTNTRSMPKIVHLIPMDGLGGVEGAARSLVDDDRPYTQIWFMAGKSLVRSRMIREISPELTINTPRAFLRTLRELMNAKPEVLVCSLWRSGLIGLALKLIIPRTKLVLMVHNTRYAHFLDRVITKCMARRATMIFCDSAASRKALVPRSCVEKTRVISFVLNIQENADSENNRTRDFVYWGRLVPLKQVPHAIRIFEKIHMKFPDAKFLIYGPLEHGGVPAIKEAISGSPSGAAIKLMGAKSAGQFPPEIRKASFFLMTSANEGMAIGVVEAMQLGLIPVTTPVGEIASYCQNGVNSIVVTSEEQAVSDVAKLLRDEGALSRMRQSATDHWRRRPSYVEDFNAACELILDAH